MNILLLGNGFDLHHEFPTAYIDFLHTIKFFVEHYDESTMKTVAEVFGDERLKGKSQNIAKSYSKYGEFYKKILLDTTVIKSLIKKAQKNMWFKYFLNAVEADEESTWIDFEKKIVDVIGSFSDFFDKGDFYIDPHINSKEYKTKYLLLQFDFFYESVNDGANKNYRYPNRFKVVKEEYKIGEPIGSERIVINKNKIIKALYEGLVELSDMLKEYLYLFIDSLCKKIKEEFWVKNPSYPRFDYICTYNYTNTYELLYNSKARICHIHGNVNNNIVLGVNPNKDDEIETVNTSFIQFKKYYQRVFYRTDIEYLELLEELECNKQGMNKEKVLLYVAGHSLNETDKDTIKSLFEYASEIMVFYHEESKVGDYINNLISIYGKQAFDDLRLNSKLRFSIHEPTERCTYDQL